MLTHRLEAIRMSAAAGAEARGLAPSRPLTDADRDFLRKAWREHLVLVVRGVADLSAAAQMDFCRVFGEIGARARPAETRHEPDGAPAEVMYVSNKRENGRVIGSIPDGEMEWHIDQSYMANPAKGTCLYAIEVPREGGDTMFGNLYQAWETLPDDLRRAVEGRKVVNAYGHGGYGIQTRDANDPRAATRSHAHPIVATHPDTGRKLLYVNRLMSLRVEGLPEDESDELLFRLFDHAENPEFRFTHKWKQGDLLLWDNRCTIHARADFDKTQTRHLRRFSIRGDAVT